MFNPYTPFPGDLNDVPSWFRRIVDAGVLDGAITALTVNNATDLAAAIAAAPVGGTVLLGPGFWPSFNITRNDIKVLGSGKPRFNGTRAQGGTIIQGHIQVQGVNVELGYMGIDQTQVAVSSEALGVQMASQATIANFYGHDLMFVGQGNAAGSAHGCLFQPGTRFLLERFEAYYYQHGVAIRGSQAWAIDGYCEDCDANAIIFKSDDQTGVANDCIDSGCMRIVGNAKTGGKSACFTAQAAGVVQTLRNVRIAFCRSYNAIGDAFTAVSTSSGVPDGVHFEQCYAEGAINSAPGAGSGVFLYSNSINCTVEGVTAKSCQGYSFWCASASIANNNTGKNNLSVSPGTGDFAGVWLSLEINGSSLSGGAMSQKSAGGQFHRAHRIMWGDLTNAGASAATYWMTNGGADDLYTTWRAYAPANILTWQYSPNLHSPGAESFTITALAMDTKGHVQLGNAQTPAFAASYTPDISLGSRITVGTLTANITINAPSNVPSKGTVVEFYFLEDGTGGWTVTWNAAYIFPTAWTNTGNTLGKKSSIRFMSDGAVLVAMGANSWY